MTKPKNKQPGVLANSQLDHMTDAEIARRQRNGKRWLGAAAVAALVVLGTVVVQNGENTSSPKQEQAEQAEREFITRNLGQSLEMTGESNVVAPIRLSLKPGVRLRSTPTLSESDGDSGVKGNDAGTVPEAAQPFDIDYPLHYVDSDGNEFYGFSFLTESDKTNFKAEEVTVWVSTSVLRQQENEARDRGEEEVSYFSIAPLEPLGQPNQTLEFDTESGRYVASVIDPASPQLESQNLVRVATVVMNEGQ